MKLLSIIILSSVFFTINYPKACGQGLKKDTVFYLLDTSKIPINDRIWSSEIEGPFKCYTIQCRCLKYNLFPTFIYNLNSKGETITGLQFKKTKFIALSKLINLLHQNGGESFNKNYLTYIVEPDGERYIRHLVRLVTPKKNEPSIDSETIKMN